MIKRFGCLCASDKETESNEEKWNFANIHLFFQCRTAAMSRTLSLSLASFTRLSAIGYKQLFYAVVSFFFFERENVPKMLLSLSS